MCGILGYYHAQIPIKEKVFERMLGTLSRRGPDGSDSIFLEKNYIALGHSRLSIIDLSEAGSQPMSNEDETIWLTFNGEIYNFRALRQTLEQKGHIFRSDCDSESIIHAYEEWGIECVNYFRGIFAFGIYDCQNSTFFLARDHIGVKPLYYSISLNEFIFASLPRAILASSSFATDIDFTALSLYLAYGNIPAEYCIYKGINKLLPGHRLIFKEGKSTIQQYWKATYQPNIFNPEEAEERLRAKIEDSISLQTISDVRVASLLSGGIDSTIVTALLKQKTSGNTPSFTIGFQENESDESAHAQLVASYYQTEHHQEILTYENAVLSLNSIADAFDEPFHLNGLFPFYALSQYVQKNRIKVALGGDGADELFAGYLWHEKFGQKRRSIKEWARLLVTMSNLDLVKIFFSYNGFFGDKDQEDILGNEFVRHASVYEILSKHWDPHLPRVMGGQILDINCFLVDHCLTKVDRASMACGVEVRVPFLDIELVELILSIDHKISYMRNERKALLKKTMRHLFPPMMDIERKKGFSSPIKKWVNKGLGTVVEPILVNSHLCRNGYISRTFIQNQFPQLSSNKQLLLISLAVWFHYWIENDYDFAEQINL